jgi:glycosyltransferase involved in cell wall biosynthesis
MASFARHLPEWGITPSALTVSNTHYAENDCQLMEHLPDDMRIEKSYCLNYLQLLRWLRGNNMKSDSPGKLSQSAAEKQSESPLRTLHQWIMQYILIPDPEIGWLPSAVLKGRTMLRGQSDIVFLTSSPPDSVHLIGLFLKKWTGLPWVADFRDQWTTNILHRKKFSSPAVYRINQYMEKSVLQSADLVLANTPTNAQNLLDHYQFLSPDKIKVLPNGFEGDPEPDASPASTEGPLRLQYNGMAYRGMLDGFWQGLEKLKSISPSSFEQIELRVIGWLNEEDKHRAESLGLEQRLIHEGPVSRRESVNRMKDCDVLLYAVPDQPGGEGWVPSKLYAYLASGKPILSLASGGDATRLVEKAQAGWPVSPSDATAVARILIKLLDKKRRGVLAVERNLNTIKKYNRRALAGCLAEYFKQLMSRHA